MPATAIASPVKLSNSGPSSPLKLPSVSSAVVEGSPAKKLRFTDKLQVKIIIVVPRASEKEGQVRLDYSLAPTQLALLSPICFPRSKRPIAATRCNPRWLVNSNSGLTQSECGRLQPLLCPRHHRQIKQAVKTLKFCTKLILILIHTIIKNLTH